MQLKKDRQQVLLRLFGHCSVVLLIGTTLTLDADNFDDFKKSSFKSFKEYKDSKDNDFNKYLKEQWSAYNMYKGTPLYEEPKPHTIVPAESKKVKSVGPVINVKIKEDESSKALADDKKFVSNIPKEKIITEVQKPEKKLQENKPDVVSKDVNFDFFGSKLSFNVSSGFKKAKFFPQNQEGIQNFFDSAASSEYTQLIEEIKTVSNNMNLNDWGVYLLVQEISNNIHTDSDNANLMSWFIFNKLGYAVRVGLAQERVILMHYSEKTIYSTPNYIFSNKKFYVISNYNKNKIGRLYSYKQDYPGATKAMDLSLNTLPKFKEDVKKKSLSFDENSIAYNITFEYNKNLIDFMATYPQADYDTYFNAPLEYQTYKSIANSLKKHIDGKKVGDAINFVLHFVQKSFKYERDEEQFGREKVMFAAETLYFDKSDCEDRAILFSYLVKELFNINVIGVKYKDHMATALYVPMTGDSVRVGQKKFVIADPTYINASVGQSMTKYKSVIPDSFIIVKKESQKSSLFY